MVLFCLTLINAYAVSAAASGARAARGVSGTGKIVPSGVVHIGVVVAVCVGVHVGVAVGVFVGSGVGVGVGVAVGVGG